MKGGYPSDNENVKEGRSTAESVFFKNKDIFTSKKKLIFEKQQEQESDLLNEDNIKDLDN